MMGQRFFYRVVGILIFVTTIARFPTQAQFNKHIDKPKVAAVPLITYNRSYGGIFGAFGTLYFPINKRDTLSPASSVGMGGMISTNKTWFGFGFGKLYYAKDLFRTVLAGGRGDQNFQYYNENYGTSGSFINYSTLLNFIYGEQLVRTYGRLYTGVSFTYYKAKTTFEDEVAPDSASVYKAIGIPITFDTRDNVNNPSTGWYSNARINRFDKALGSATEYTKLDLDASHYFHKKAGHVFAYKASINTALGKVPFEAQTIVGGKVLRGYSKGEYRGDQVYSLQGEYRVRFHKKWGSVFFAGAAVPVSKGDADLNFLPSAGAGIRFLMIPDIGINIGLDAAVGKDDYGIYFRIGEAF
ncbi:MAG: BamA/TamA family outer membrane protein [Cyclobacteriaceae bacterium]|jgi:outer membrane protein assembly factor BamA|nr:BamA/TamA family outer membrane protein [Cyclobacteriaceae bacterium]